ncbi:MAG TPA: hypothetical protein PKY86_05450 [Niabella sp.]|nr:hypothetical protein [Niabella sp.]HQW14671.1 hypothetical protein [Niabella sp.]HQX19810.1 hypothetical protein [Niabella sp.]HQX42275.1 hypothetical protein [Niabella sp.]HRB08328.1 hypothetical protein [Niabella sp.]
MNAAKQIFFSYSDIAQDKDLYSKINRHFSSYVRSKIISIVDKDTIFKQSADKTIAFELIRKSDLTVPLISADYLANDECYELLKTAISEKKDIVPILIRDVDIESEPELRLLKNRFLPEDGKSVLEHFDQKEDDDIILVAISKQIKDSAFREFKTVRIANDSKTFYFILAAIVLGMGITATIYVKQKLNDTTITIFTFLLFLSIALFAIKNALFPTGFKRN